MWINDSRKNWTDTYKIAYLSLFASFFRFCVEEGYLENLLLYKKRWVKAVDNYWEVQQPFANEKNKVVVNEYLLNLKSLNQTERTIDDKRIFLQLFFRDRKKHFSLITENEVEEWLEQQQNDKKRKTVFCYLSFLRNFYCFTIRKGYMEKSPVKYRYKKRKEEYGILTKPIANEENRQIINEFLLNMKIFNYSKEYIYRVENFLHKFFKDIEVSLYIITSDYIRNWFIEHQNKWNECTLKHNLGMLSIFYTFVVEEGHLEKSPIKSIWYPKLPKPLPKYLEDSEISKVRFEMEKESLRNRAIFEFFITSGCRLSELHSLNRLDINFVNRTARILGKGKKIRTVHFTEKCEIILEQYLESRTDDEPALFISYLGNRLGIYSIRKIINKIGVKAKLTKSLYPHRLRHTFATKLLKNGADLLFIADELGHNDVQTTKIYAHLPNKELIAMYRKYMG